jgi:hypothetical protein
MQFGFVRGLFDPEGLAVGMFFGRHILDFDRAQRLLPRRGRAANDPATGLLG